MSADSLSVLAQARALVTERNLTADELAGLVRQLRQVAELPARGGFATSVAKDCRRLADELEQPTKNRKRR